MVQTLDYATVHRKRGAGYAIILVVNAIALLASIWVLLLGTERDAWTSLFMLILGVPIVLVELGIGTLPAMIYAARHGSGLSLLARWLLIASATLPPVVGVVGIVLGLTLTATHGSAC